MIRGDELSIFADQRAFLGRLAAAGHRGLLAIPGTSIEIRRDGFDVVHPIADADVHVPSARTPITSYWYVVKCSSGATCV
jgi:hypothetical protein